MFEKADCVCVFELFDHFREDGANGVEALVGLADVVEAGVVEEDFLYDEDCDCFA